MSLIEFQNYPSTETPLNAENLNHNFNELAEKNIITASISSNYAIKTDSPDTYEMLPLSTYTHIGDKLTLENGKIVIGKNVSLVKISAKLSFNTLTAGLKWVTVFGKNDTAVLANPNQLSGRATVSCSDALVSVKEGDTLELRVLGLKDDVVRSGLAYTYLTVEVIN